VFPYFVQSVWAMLGITVALLMLLWAALQRGM
jgi:hypothetical protein